MKIDGYIVENEWVAIGICVMAALLILAGIVIGAKWLVKCPDCIAKDCPNLTCPEAKECPNCEVSCPTCVCQSATQMRILTKEEREICNMESQANTSCFIGLNSIQYCGRGQYAKQLEFGCVCKERECPI